jgi:putative endopeptidase
MSVTRRDFGLGALIGTTALATAGGALAKGAAHGAGWGVDLTQMDPAVAPGDDFFRHVNGKWLATTQIPSDRARLAEFNRLDDLNSTRTRAILEAAAKSPTNPEARKMGDFYASLMDEAGVEARGAAPLQGDLTRIAAIATPADLARAIAEVTRQWLPPLPGGASPVPPAPIAAGVTVDNKQPTRYLPALSQGGIGLPDRDYFLLDEPAFQKARAAYRTHLTAMFKLAGLSDPEARGGRVYALEEKIAKTHWTRAAQRDADKRYNLFRRAELSAKAPGLDWDAFLDACGFAGQDLFLVGQPSAIAGASALTREVGLEDWRDYLAFRAIRNFAPVGPKAFVDEYFAFNDRTLAGTPELPARWKRAGQVLDRAMGHAVGRVYLAKYFPPAARAQAQAMTGQIKAAMGRRITALAWMAPQTKARALTKLAAARIEIGGQTPLRTYAGLAIERGDAYGNYLRAARFERDRNLGKPGRPVDRGEWSMVPQTVNAQANPVLVKIMFPAGIMQGHFFNPDADPAVNYGAIGVVMGHELSHLFDDQGSKFDEKGALNNWWTPADLKQFTAATDALARQYDTYEPLPGAHINGRLTLGENIADLAGLSLARDAYYASLGGKPAPVIGGYSADQRFYLSYAQLYRSLSRDGFMRQALATDPHSPGEWRAAEVRNVDPWYAAFKVTPGQKMYLAPDQRVRIW